MKRIIGLALATVILGLGFTSGCITRSQKSGKELPRITTKPVVVETPRPKPQPTKPETPSERIVVKRNEPIVVQAGDADGVYLGLESYVEAIDSKTGARITEFAFGSPQFGSLKAYPEGHMRYYPPDKPCQDEVEVRPICEDGYSSKVVTLHIDVRSPSGESRGRWSERTSRSTPEQVRAGRIKITAPSEVAQRICNLSGTAPGHEGEELTLIVRNKWGVDYEQDCHPKVENGKFTGWVYLGDEYGQTASANNSRCGAVDSSGGKSNVVLVKRTN